MPKACSVVTRVSDTPVYCQGTRCDTPRPSAPPIWHSTGHVHLYVVEHSKEYADTRFREVLARVLTYGRADAVPTRLAV